MRVQGLHKDAGRAIFAKQQIDGFALDVEVLAIARRWDYKILEIGIPWTYGPGQRRQLRDPWRKLRES